MPEIVVAIVGIADEAFPGFVVCTLVDAHGREHMFIEKAPVVSTEDISAASVLPMPGYVACEIVAALNDERGRSLLRVDTSRPYGIESVSGETMFELLQAQVSR